MSRDDEIDELILYVTDMRRSFTRKMDEQLFIIQEQNDRIRRQRRTIDEQKEVVDELAWQIRDLRDSVRRVKESLTSVTQSQSCGCQCSQLPSQPPQAAPRRIENLVAEGAAAEKKTSAAITNTNEPVYARISFGKFAANKRKTDVMLCADD